MRRREFIAALGGAAVWPVVARTQTVRTVGVLHSAAPSSFTDEAFEAGLKEAGFTKGHNLRVETRWARGSYQLLPGLAEELLKLGVDVFATFGTPAARVSKLVAASNPTVPIVFAMGSDPVTEGLVQSLNRPGGNITGITSIAGALASKRLELMREFFRPDARLALLINPDNPLSRVERQETEDAARASGQQIDVVTARNEQEIEAAFASLPQRNVSVLIIAVDTYFYVRMQQMATLAARYGVRAIGPLREFSTNGGLMSYGASIGDVNRQAGVYAGRILSGAKPSELPVLQPTKFELVINLKSARTLGVDFSPKIMALADEAIE